MHGKRQVLIRVFHGFGSLALVSLIIGTRAVIAPERSFRRDLNDNGSAVVMPAFRGKKTPFSRPRFGK
jgi:hypothetical protein